MTAKVKARGRGVVPFGYSKHPDNPHLIVENSEHREVLHNLRELSQYQSLRKLITYVQAHTGRKLTPRGIQQIIRRGY